MDCAAPTGYRVKIKENEKNKQIIGPCEKKKIIENVSNGDTSNNWSVWNGPQSLSKGTERVGN